LFELFSKFLDNHQSWSAETKTACTYSFFHAVNLINSNLRKDDANSSDVEKYTFDNDIAKHRSLVIDEAISAIKSCELTSPNVRRIRLDEAIGSLISLK
jgi:hypothetical protein